MSEPSVVENVSFAPMEYKADDIGCMLLEPITKGLYADPRHVIREYVQNEVDSKPAASELHIRVDGNSISVWGNGAGMDEEDLNIARKIGFSTKNPKVDVGFRGIGIWSAVGYVNQIIISTKKAGTKRRLLLRIDARGLREEIDKRSTKPLTKVLSENVSKAEDKDREPRHYTHVRMVDAIDNRLLDSAGIAEYCRGVLPVTFDDAFPYKKAVEGQIAASVPTYRVAKAWVGNTELFRPPFYKDLDPPKFGLIQHPKYGTLAWYWVCFNKESRQISRDDSWGIVFKVKGFTIGDRSLTRQLFPGKASHLPPWTVGEIHLINQDILPDAERTNFVPTQTRDALDESIKKVFESFNEEIRRKSHVTNLKDVLAAIKNEKKSVVCETEAEKLERSSVLVDYRKKLKRGRTHTWTPQSMRDEIDKGITKTEKLISGIKVRSDGQASSTGQTTVQDYRQSSETQSGSEDGSYRHEPSRTEVTEILIEVVTEFFKPNEKQLKALREEFSKRLSRFLG